MSRSARKQAQREAIEKAVREQQRARWNPQLPPEELAHFRKSCERMFAVLESVSRPAAVAVRPAHDQPTPRSHFGGAMLMASTDSWPQVDGRLLSGVMEIHLSELPTRPSPLEGFELLQVFLELKTRGDTPAYQGGNWAVRRIEKADGMSPMSHAPVVAEIPVAWNLQHDIPKYPDDLALIPGDVRNEFEKLPNWSALLADRFPSSLSTRVGGWPQWVEGCGVDGTFCLQIDGFDVDIDLGFDGCLFFGFDEETQSWDCKWEIG